MKKENNIKNNFIECIMTCIAVMSFTCLLIYAFIQLFLI
jgi:hypothetical protein